MRLNLDKERILKNINIVLVSPQIPENIGLVSRVLKNTKVTNLRLVRPFLSSKSFEVAKRASDVLKKAKTYESLEDAIQDLYYTFGTTRRHRKYKLIYNFINILPQIIFLASGKKIGIIFGQEDFGLSKKDLELCDSIFYIPANPDFSSYNLAMSVGIVCFEIFNFLESIYSFSSLDLARRKDIEALFGFIEKRLKKVESLPRKDLFFSSARRTLRKLLLTKKEVEILKTIFLKMQL